MSGTCPLGDEIADCGVSLNQCVGNFVRLYQTRRKASHPPPSPMDSTLPTDFGSTFPGCLWIGFHGNNLSGSWEATGGDRNNPGIVGFSSGCPRFRGNNQVDLPQIDRKTSHDRKPQDLRCATRL